MRFVISALWSVVVTFRYVFASARLMGSLAGAVVTLYAVRFVILYRIAG